MEQQSSIENWQVKVGGQVYDATFDDLSQWIDEGALHPGDKVRRGNLRWIEANKVPGLIPFFNAKSRGEAMPIVISTIDSPRTASEMEEERPIDVEEISESAPAAEAAINSPIATEQKINSPDRCAIHGELESVFLCDGCACGFCKACPKSYGGTVKVCPTCGSLCRAVAEARVKAANERKLQVAVDKGFGFADLLQAFVFPFKFKTSLFFGAVMFAIFSVSQSATAIGGMVMFASAIICFMLANTLTFGVLANTVTNFAQGDVESSFMPSFDDFSAWDDVVHPFFLSIAVYIGSFGPFIAAALVAMYLVASSSASQMDTFQSEVERLPGTQYYQGRETVEQSEQVKRVLSDITKNRDGRIGEYNEAAAGNSNAVTTATPDEADEFVKLAQENRRKELEAAFGKTQETKDREFSEFTSSLLKLAAPLVVIGAITLLWGLFFFPAACAVAGYTRSFSATINPLVALDTIKRLKGDYAKVMVMFLGLLLISGFFGFLFALVFSPFNLPGMGNIVAKWFSSLIIFYLSVVFSCVLGYALFKNSGKLQLLR